MDIEQAIMKKNLVQTEITELEYYMDESKWLQPILQEVANLCSNNQMIAEVKAGDTTQEKTYILLAEKIRTIEYMFRNKVELFVCDSDVFQQIDPHVALQWIESLFYRLNKAMHFTVETKLGKSIHSYHTEVVNETKSLVLTAQAALVSKACAIVKNDDRVLSLAASAAASIVTKLKF